MNKTLLVIFALVAVVSAVRFPIESESAPGKAESKDLLQKIFERIQNNKHFAEAAKKLLGEVAELQEKQKQSDKVQDRAGGDKKVEDLVEEKAKLNDDSFLANEAKIVPKKPAADAEEKEQNDDSDVEFKINFGLAFEGKKPSKENPEEEEEPKDGKISSVDSKIELRDLFEYIFGDQKEEGEDNDSMKLDKSEDLNKEDADKDKLSNADVKKYVAQIDKLMENLPKSENAEEEEEDDSNADNDVMISYGLEGKPDNKNLLESKALSDKEAVEKFSVDAIFYAIKKLAADNGFNLNKQEQIVDNEKLRFDNSDDKEEEVIPDVLKAESVPKKPNGPTDDEDIDEASSGEKTD